MIRVRFLIEERIIKEPSIPISYLGEIENPKPNFECEFCFELEEEEGDVVYAVCLFIAEN